MGTHAFWSFCCTSHLAKSYKHDSFNLIDNGVYVYLDDVIIYAKTKEVHDSLLVNVMMQLKQHNLQLKVSKCLFYARQFDYLSHVISKDGIRANPKKVEVINNYPRPVKVKDIQSFLGMCNYFRRYVRDFAKISKPLTMLLKKEQPFIWTQCQQEAFDRLKKALAEDIILKFSERERSSNLLLFENTQ